MSHKTQYGRGDQIEERNGENDGEKGVVRERGKTALPLTIFCCDGVEIWTKVLCTSHQHRCASHVDVSATAAMQIFTGDFDHNSFIHVKKIRTLSNAVYTWNHTSIREKMAFHSIQRL